MVSNLYGRFPLKIPMRKDIPIVFLTNCYTASAGEMTAISLVGRKNTYVVGETTAGCNTVVQGSRIKKDAGLNLSTDHVVDRNSKIYTIHIQPDIEVLQGGDLKDLKDKKIIKQRNC